MVLQGVDVNAQNEITILKLSKYLIQPFHNILNQIISIHKFGTKQRRYIKLECFFIIM